MEHHDFNDAERSILIALSDSENGKRINEILEITGMSKPTFSRNVKRLIELGLVTKEIRANEGYPPPVYYCLTDKGRKIAKEIIKRNAINRLTLVSKLPRLSPEKRKRIEETIKMLEEL